MYVSRSLMIQGELSVKRRAIERVSVLTRNPQCESNFLASTRKGERSNKAQLLTSEEESALWEKGQLGDFSGNVLTNVNFKNLTEQLGLRGRQEHYNAYVKDVIIRQQEDGTEVVEFREDPSEKTER